MVSATGQARHRARFSPQMPGYSFIPFADLGALEAALDAGTAPSSSSRCKAKAA